MRCWRVWYSRRPDSWWRYSSAYLRVLVHLFHIPVHAQPIAVVPVFAFVGPHHVGPEDVVHVGSVGVKVQAAEGHGDGDRGAFLDRSRRVKFNGRRRRDGARLRCPGHGLRPRPLAGGVHRPCLHVILDPVGQSADGIFQVARGPGVASLGPLGVGLVGGVSPNIPEGVGGDRGTAGIGGSGPADGEGPVARCCRPDGWSGRNRPGRSGVGCGPGTVTGGVHRPHLDVVLGPRWPVR